MKKRDIWMDAARILCAFLVIVNHTNSGVFQSASPSEAVWWLSSLWYALSKIAVPVFVLISGACLLGREDSYRRCFGRFLRIAGALLAFSYGYFLYDAWVYYGLFPRMFDMKAFFTLIWTEGITDGFWYLYFYAGLMLVLPILQRLSCAMRGRDCLYLCALCFGFSALWPLMEHLVPALALPKHFQLPMISGYLGLFFAGMLVRKANGKTVLSSLTLLAAVACGVAVMRCTYAPGARYWAFMDDRMNPGFLTIIAAIAFAVLMKGLFRRPLPEKAQKVWMELGGCAFGIYLVQDFLIAQTKVRLYQPLLGVMGAFPAVLVWEIAVFGVAFIAAFVMRRIPLLKKLV